MDAMNSWLLLCATVALVWIAGGVWKIARILEKGDGG